MDWVRCLLDAQSSHSPSRRPFVDLVTSKYGSLTLKREHVRFRHLRSGARCRARQGSRRATHHQDQSHARAPLRSHCRHRGDVRGHRRVRIRSTSLTLSRLDVSVSISVWVFSVDVRGNTGARSRSSLVLLLIRKIFRNRREDVWATVTGQAGHALRTKRRCTRRRHTPHAHTIHTSEYFD